MTLPTSTTNITGLRATSRGSSLANELPIAGQMSWRMEAALRLAPCCASGLFGLSRSWRHVSHEKRWPAFIRKCSTIGPRASAGK